MKKSLFAVAGVAALAAVAMPAAGVFADTMSVKDSLTVTVGSSCTLASITPAAATSTDGNPYTASGNPGALLDFTATTSATTFTVNCNDQDGYTITPTFTSLMLGGVTSSQDIVYGTAAANAQEWTAYYSKNSGPATAFTASGTAITGTSTMTDTYTFSYKVGLGSNQAAGAYTGTASYALAAI